MIRRGIVGRIGRETIRVTLANHELKPWREKMWCVPALDGEFVARMEDVLREPRMGMSTDYGRPRGLMT